jgi:hypothetical protein
MLASDSPRDSPPSLAISNHNTRLQSVLNVQRRAVAGFCPFVESAARSMRPHSETPPLADRPKGSRAAPYLIYSQALTRKSPPRTTGHILAMHEMGNTAECLGRIRRNIGADNSAISLADCSHQRVLVFERLENKTLSI